MIMMSIVMDIDSVCGTDLYHTSNQWAYTTMQMN